MKFVFSKIAVSVLCTALILPAVILSAGTGCTVTEIYSSSGTAAVTYNGNGNTAGSVPSDPNSYTNCQMVTVLSNSGNLTKTGCSFSGWNTSPYGSGTTLTPGMNFIIGTASVDLYAIWTPNDIPYNITYYGNGNTGGIVPEDPAGYTNGQLITLLGNTGYLVCSGYTFGGWNTRADGSGTTYSPGQQMIMAGPGTSLYAVWVPIPTYSIAYIGNGNTGGILPVDGGSYSNGQPVIVSGNTGNLIRTGYTFACWNTTSAGTGISFNPGSSINMVTGGITLYVMWVPTYTVTYNGNGGSGGTVPVDGNVYTNGQAVTVPGNTGNLIYTGKTFTGWNTQANGSGTTYGQGADFSMVHSNIILYAFWTSNPTYTVTYYGSGSTGGAVPVDSTQYQNGQTVTVQGNTGNLAKTGYVLSSWSNASGLVIISGQTFPMGTANVFLYAVWAPTYTVTYNGSSSTGGFVPDDTNYYTNGQPVTVFGNISNLVKTGYEFSSWSNSAGVNFACGHVFSMGSTNVNLYAIWSPEYNVAYNGNGYTGGSVPIDADVYTNGQLVTVSGNTGDLVKSGYAFSCWDTTNTGTGTAFTGGQTFIMGPENYTLYAIWVPVYTVTFNNQGGTPAFDTEGIISDDQIGVLPAAPSFNNYIFEGWFSAVNGSGTAFTAGTTVISNITVYAYWLDIITNMNVTTNFVTNLKSVSNVNIADKVYIIQPGSTLDIDATSWDGIYHYAVMGTIGIPQSTNTTPSSDVLSIITNGNGRFYIAYAAWGTYLDTSVNNSQYGSPTQFNPGMPGAPDTNKESTGLWCIVPTSNNMFMITNAGGCIDNGNAIGPQVPDYYNPEVTFGPYNNPDTGVNQEWVFSNLCTNYVCTFAYSNFSYCTVYITNFIITTNMY